MSTQRFTFNFFRFTGNQGNRTTEIVRDLVTADGMRTLVERNPQLIQEAINRVSEWSTAKGVTVNAKDPYPSQKYPGKVWLEFRFTGLTL